MFTYFHENRLISNLRKNKKGQLAPVFILLLVLMIIMAMVTLNLSKVSLVKTDTANAVDAGALAAGSTMSNLFNSVATGSADSEKQYWEFFASISLSFIWAIYQLASAQSSIEASRQAAMSARPYGCPGIAPVYTPCACKNPETGQVFAAVAVASAVTALSIIEDVLSAGFIETAIAITLAESAYAATQWYWYRLLRESARKARIQSRQLGYSIAFANSGIGSKLKPGPAPEALAGSEDKNNYRQSFSDFTDTISAGDEDDPTDPPASLTYSWKDGQGRAHSVEVKTTIDETNEFEVITMAMPFPAEFALAIAIIVLGFTARAELQSALVALVAMNVAFITAIPAKHCCQSNPYCFIGCLIWYAACAAAPLAADQGIFSLNAAQGTISSIYGPLAANHMGLLPNPIPIRDPDRWIEGILVPLWIDDIDHDRQVKIETTQNHEGGDLVFWQTQYPVTYSYSVVSFEGEGKINPPEPRFDSSIIKTDIIGQSAPQEGSAEEGGG